MGALLQLAQDLEQMPPDVGSLPPSQLRGVHGGGGGGGGGGGRFMLFLLYAPVAVRWRPGLP